MSSLEDNRDFVASLAKGLAVIRAFGRDAPEQTLTEVATRTGMSRAAARRFLHTLTSMGYAEMDGKRFRLTPKVLDLGYAYLASLSLAEIAQPFMEQVTATVQESCSACVLDGTEIVYVARVPTKRIMSVSLSIGTRLPAYATSMGRVLLSGLSAGELERVLDATELKPLTVRTVTDRERLLQILEQVRRNGYALVDEELEEGVRSIAVPLHNRSGRVVAAMNVSGHSSRVTPDYMLSTYLPALRCAAEGIERCLP